MIRVHEHRHALIYPDRTVLHVVTDHDEGDEDQRTRVVVTNFYVPECNTISIVRVSRSR